MTTTRLNNRGQTFEQWYTATDLAVSAICGLGVDDLPDGNSWDAWNDDTTPRDYAIMLLEEEGFPLA